MQPYDNTPAGRDPELWQLAKRRAKFKIHLFTYLWVNALLWGIWFFTDGGHVVGRHGYHLPWPAFVSFFWGISLVFQALGVYGAFGRGSLAEHEYERLSRRQ